MRILICGPSDFFISTAVTCSLICLRCRLEASDMIGMPVPFHYQNDLRAIGFSAIVYHRHGTIICNVIEIVREDSLHYVS